jgi:hypothetical protein
MQSTRVVALLCLALATVPVGAQTVLVDPYGDQVVLTDPLVRTTQLGYLPVGTLTGGDPRTGAAIASVPGVGQRWVQLLGAPVATASGLVAPAMDLATGVQLLVVVPPVQERLVPATVLRATANGVTVRRRGAPAGEAEVLPYASIYVSRGGRTLPAASAGAQLSRGASVLIPATSGARGAILVQRPARPTSAARKTSMARRRR